MQPYAAHLLPGPRRGRAQARPQALARVLLIVGLLILSQIFIPFQRAEGAAAALGPQPLDEVTLNTLTGGCYSCGGGSSGDEDASPYPIGSPYWEYSHRYLISRPDVPAYLVWHRKNTTSQTLGPISIEYETRKKLNWEVEAGVPNWFVRGHLGGEYETRYMETVRLSIPPRTYYKFFVKYPYARWRYYYRQWQDYSDNSREIVGAGDVIVNTGWTLTNVVDGPVY